MASGYTQTVPFWERGVVGFKRGEDKIVNRRNISIWKEYTECIWKLNGVWKSSNKGPLICNSNHFTHVKGKKIHFEKHFYTPFLENAYQKIRNIDSAVHVFFENRVGQRAPRLLTQKKENVVFSFHWYDALIMVFRRFVPFLAIDIIRKKLVVGSKKKIHQSLSRQINQLMHRDRKHLGKVPAFLTEFGCFFSLDEKKRYFNDKNRVVVKALDRSYRAVEENLVSSCLWNYDPNNTIMKGDYWNGEDFSIFSYDLVKNIDHPLDGLKATEAFIRPFAQTIAGRLLEMRFTLSTRKFECKWKSSVSDLPTELYIPTFHYPKGFKVELNCGLVRYEQNSQKLLIYNEKKVRVVSLSINPIV